MPAAPPKKAISTSQMAGSVRANSFDEASESGVIKKQSVEAARLMPTNAPMLRNDCRMSGAFCTPRP
jgi:hypothetical protein